MSLSILMNTANQRCNAFASVVGIFLHGHNVPEKVVEVLSRIGVCISQSAIHGAIKSLSKDADTRIRALGQSLLVAYAYDNFDVNLKSAKPTLQAQSTTSLKHLTSALIFPLPRGTTLLDMKCSQWLWERSRLNDLLPDNRVGLEAWPSYELMLKIHPSYRVADDDGLDGRDRFNVWMFLRDLIQYGPLIFRKFLPQLGFPEVIEQIPREKTEATPARAMKYSNSTVSGNIETIEDLLRQGGVGSAPAAAEGSASQSLPADVEKAIKEIGDYVILFHGDLNTGERIRQALRRRAMELTGFDRQQYVLFVFGLFHLKMACADAIWRIFLKGKPTHGDPTSVMSHVQVLRPRDWGSVRSDPGFRRMHQVIEHDGHCRRLDCWRVEVEKTTGFKSLEEWGVATPDLTIADLRAIAKRLATGNVARAPDIKKLRQMLADDRDNCFENSLQINMFYLLYQELSWGMNAGDIGRVEVNFAAWVPVFRGINKHKYAAELVKHITNVHKVYPTGLRYVAMSCLRSSSPMRGFTSRAVRYSMLINPTGKPGKFRGSDWAVELQNMSTKVHRRHCHRERKMY